MPLQSESLGQDPMVRREDVVEAVNYLIHSRDCTTRINEIRDVIERWEERPMIYAGHLMVLNSLIDIGVEDRKAFEKLVDLIEERRRLIPVMRRADYQRDLMRERRARLAKAIELQELQHGKMDARTRKRFEKDITQRWSQAQQEFLKKKGRLTWAQRNAARREFWDMIDKNLEKNIQAEKAKKLQKR